MKRAVRRALAIALSCACATAGSALAEEGRFDAEIFRPSPSPRDLVMVQKSEIVGHLSPVVGLYLHYSLDPLVLVNRDTRQTLDAVGGRFEMVGLASLGLFHWVDVGVAVPFIAAQQSDNLRSIGTEGPVESTVMGDVRVQAKVMLPYLNRRARIKEGFGMALSGHLNLPSGNVNAFTSDGTLTGGFALIADYRFNFGLIVAANAGMWLRPDRDFGGIRIGNMFSFGLGAEMNVVQRWGLSVIGNVYGHASLVTFPDSPRQVPTEGLLGLRWQSSRGITVTVGGSFGADCGFGAPAVRFFAGLTWQPKSSREQAEIERLKAADSDDPDHDGLVGRADKCPHDAGPPQNEGCPDQDKDKDGIVDRLDECPELPAAPGSKSGCPMAYVKGDEIVILDQVHFATDRDIILDESKPILEAVARVLIEHPDIRLVRIEGHTDIRAGDAYNLNLSQRRVNSVMHYLVEEQHIDESRLQAQGFGHLQPLFDDSGCNRPDEQLGPSCLRLTAGNRRVVFHIERVGAAPPRPLSGAPAGTSAILPARQNELPTTGVLPTKGAVLPKKTNVLPSQGVLDPTGTLPPAKTPEPAPRLLPSTPHEQGPMLPKASGMGLRRSGAPRAKAKHARTKLPPSRGTAK